MIWPLSRFWPPSREVEDARQRAAYAQSALDVGAAELRSISFQDLWGQGADIDDIRAQSIKTATTLVPVFAATRKIADTIAAMPLEAYRKVGDERIPIDLPPLFTDPSLFGGFFEWVQRALTSLLLKGNAYGLITSWTYDGWPRWIEWLHPDEVSIMNNLTLMPGSQDWRVRGRPVRQWRGRDSQGELIHIPWYVIPGFVLGLSPIGQFATTIEAGILVQRYGRNFFRSDAVPTGTLETDQPVSQQQATEIKGRFRTAVSGRDVAVLGAGLKYSRIMMPPEDSQFLQTIRATATQIASIYGLPALSIGGEIGSQSKTYASVEQEAQDLINALQPYLTKLEQAFSTLMPRPQFVKFNIDSMVRPDLKARYEAHKIALEAGFMTIDEVRRIEDLPPLAQVQAADQGEIAQILALPSATGGNP